jgi:predicted nucleic acid-binding protein
MRFVLDTNVVSEGTRHLPDAVCISWLRAHAQECCITTITLAELRYGVERLPDGKRRRILERKIEQIRQNFSEWILDFDENAAAEFGRYVSEYERSRGASAVGAADVRDLQIAAIARAHGWIVATRNTRDFPCVDWVNPFQP